MLKGRRSDRFAEAQTDIGTCSAARPAPACRGAYLDGVFEFTRQKGYGLIHGADLLARGFPDVVSEIQDRMRNRPVYLCFDMDVFDPSCAPGVCTPTWGGLTAREGLGLIESLAGLNFVGFEVNTVSPPHDAGGMTAYLAGCCILKMVVLACRSPGVETFTPLPPFPAAN